MANSAKVAQRMLQLAGWKFEGEVPSKHRFVCTASPHTSNWDGLILVLLAQSIGLRLSWMVKKSWVDGPMGGLLRRVGAVPIDRSKAGNIVEQMVQRFAEQDEFVLAVPPEGTRSRAEYWKSGFYQIALGANVPVVPGYLDFARKRGGFGPPIHLTGDVKADMDQIRAFYEAGNFTPRNPELFGPIRLRSEDPSE